MPRLVLLAVFFVMIWKGCMNSEAQSGGTFFHDVTTNQKWDATIQSITTRSFHRCSIEGHCNYVLQKELEDGQLIALKASEIPASHGGYRIWKKVKLTNKSLDSTEKKAYKSCKDAKENGVQNSQVISVSTKDGEIFSVTCDMTTEGGGWTVFQRRIDGKLSFERNWTEYEQGFGNPRGNFWLGLKKLHEMTSAENVTLRIELMHVDGEKGYAEYGLFKVGDEAAKYRLMIGGYHGSIGDSLANSNNMSFTTFDRDNDNLLGDAVNCASDYRGAWWHNKCFDGNLNNVYAGLAGSRMQEMTWRTWKGEKGNITFAEMKLR